MVSDELSDWERAIDELLDRSHFAPQHGLPGLIREEAARIGAQNAVVYLADLQQTVLVPFTERVPAFSGEVQAIDGTVAGRCYQHLEVIAMDSGDGQAHVWVPLLDGTERLGALCADLSAEDAAEVPGGRYGVRLRRFAALVAELIVNKSKYGDSVERLRRRAPMDLAAELQWSLLPPLTFSTDRVTVAGALEPAYQVAGDTFDYAIDDGVARATVVDAMGHGLPSSLLASVALAAYRNQRRLGTELVPTALAMHEALLAAFGGAQFGTAVVAELDTDTGRFSWVNAGHPPPLLLRDGRLVRELSCEPILPLGLRAYHQDPPPVAVPVGVEQLERGDRVLLYTDGVLEARSPDGEFFGEQRLVDLMGRHIAAGLPVPETMRRIVHALLAHQQGKLSDDATMLLIEWSTDTGPLRY